MRVARDTVNALGARRPRLLSLEPRLGAACSLYVGNENDAPRMTEEQADRIAAVFLGCLHREYPNKAAQVLNDDRDARPPRELTPAFFGCFDWHSAVHSHWALLRLLRRFPEADFVRPARSALAERHTPGLSRRRRDWGEQRASRPPRVCSSSPGNRCSKKRLRHLLTIWRGVSRHTAMTSFDKPCAARSTILARLTSRYRDVYFRARASTVRSRPVSVMRNGLWRGTQTSGWSACHRSKPSVTCAS